MIAPRDVFQTQSELSQAVQHEPFETYRAQARENLSSHALADFRACPLLYRRKQLGLVPDKDRPAYLIGRAAHALILEGPDAFERSFAVGGPLNPKTGKPFGTGTQAYAEWAEAQGKPVLGEEQHKLARNMAAAVQAHAEARELLADGVAEGVCRAPYRGVNCQIRMDWFNPFHGIVDLKTCDDLTWFESDARRFGYAHQVAFYRAVLRERIGRTFPVHFLAVEKKEPYRCGVWLVPPEALNQAAAENEAAIERLKLCQQTNAWTTGYESARVFEHF